MILHNGVTQCNFCPTPLKPSEWELVLNNIADELYDTPRVFNATNKLIQIYHWSCLRHATRSISVGLNLQGCFQIL